MGAGTILRAARLALLMLPLALFAAEIISWERAVDLAARNNQELQSARSNVRAFELQEGSAASAYYPQLSAGMGFSRGNRTVDNVFSEGTDDRYTVTLTATQNLFAGFGDVGRVNQAQANTRAASANLQVAKARISFDLKGAFEGLLYAKAYQQLTQQIIQRRQENLRLVELRFESGRENKGSVLLSRAYLEQARYDDLQARNAEGVARAQLAQAMGLDPKTAFDIVGAVPIDEPPSAPAFAGLARTTPTYLQSVAQQDAAQAAVTVARSGAFPTLDLSGTTGRQDSTFFPNGEDRWSVGLNLAIPLFTGGRTTYDTRAARASLAEAASNRESVAASVTSRLEQTYAAYVEAVSKLRVDDSFRQAAILRAEIARKRYNNGLMTFEEWDLVENDLIARQKTYLVSRRDRVTAEAAWEQAQGKGAIP